MFETEATTGLCAACGIPIDSQYFDVSSVQDIPSNGEEILLARFDLPAQYCGVLEYFSQYTDLFGKDSSQIRTPDLEWRILSNGQALYPYVGLRHIVNPWGFGSFQVNIRLSENSTLEFVVRKLPGKAEGDSSSYGDGSSNEEEVRLVGGRLVGRFWYNAAYGDVVGRS